jgi:molybdopterin molybdotransferase
MIIGNLLAKTMIQFEKALETVLASARQLGSERIGLADALGRVLAEDVKSDMDMPPFDKSAMDGYACRRSDLEVELRVIETIPAGAVPTKSISAGECAKIMTGGMVPEEADCVVMIEYTQKTAGDRIRFVGDWTKDNICPRGENIKAGQVVLQKGTLLKPQHVAVLASVGNAQPIVAKRPKVGVIATGDELVEARFAPARSQIRNSNGPQLAAQLSDMGAVAKDYGIAEDTVEGIGGIFKKAADENDAVIICGGVSMGDFDFVPEVLKQNNVDLIFEKVAIKPGKPTVFGTSDNVYCFGLPGNPVSGFTLFNLLVKPFLYKMMGHDYKHCSIAARIEETVTRKAADRQAWIPVVMTGPDSARPIEYHGSAHIEALCDADGLISMNVGVTEFEKGTTVTVMLI